jgi:hypothetical protein
MSPLAPTDLVPRYKRRARHVIADNVTVTMSHLNQLITQQRSLTKNAPGSTWAQLGHICIASPRALLGLIHRLNRGQFITNSNRLPLLSSFRYMD